MKTFDDEKAILYQDDIKREVIKMIVVKQHVIGIIFFFRMSKNELLEKTPDALRYGKDHFPH